MDQLETKTMCGNQKLFGRSNLVYFNVMASYLKAK